jgi:hypothetical protein
MMRSLNASAVQGGFRWPFVCSRWLEFEGRSDSQADIYVLETKASPVIVA